ncbi:MAG: hypothetical protein M1546_15695, partial [Chloroflexi bacterium]|nr:hypothetical protein [Chloroflexota bacterium]
MSLKYVLNSMRRRKLRTLIIALTLTIGVALVGALLALVDTQRQFSIVSLGAETGGYDLSITKSDLAASPFFSITEVQAAAADSYDQIAAMYARIEDTVEARLPDATEGEEVTFIAIDTARDSLVSSEQGSPTQENTGGVGVAGIRITGGGGGPRGGGGGAPPGGATFRGGPGESSSSSGMTADAGGVYPPEN